MDGKITPQNLIRQVSSESPRFRPGFYKQIVLDVLTVASAAGVGYVYSGFLGGRSSLAMLLAAVAVFAAFSVIQLFLLKNFGRRVGILFLEVIALFVQFYGKMDLRLIGIAAVVMFVFLIWGEILGKREIENSIEVRFFKSARPVFSKLTTAMILAFIVLYIPRVGPDNIFISRGSFQGFFDWAAGLVGNFYPEIRLNSTFGELAEGVAKMQLEKEERFRELSPAAKEAILKQTAEQVSHKLSQSLGIEIKPDEQVSETFYNFIVNFLSNLASRYGNLFLVGWGVVVFFLLRGLGTIFYWIAGLFIFIIYQILLASNFIYITGETRTKEVVEW